MLAEGGLSSSPHGLLGLPHSMVAGFSGRASKEKGRLKPHHLFNLALRVTQHGFCPGERGPGDPTCHPARRARGRQPLLGPSRATQGASGAESGLEPRSAWAPVGKSLDLGGSGQAWMAFPRTS